MIPFRAMNPPDQEALLDGFSSDIRSIKPVMIDGREIDMVSDLRDLESDEMIPYALCWGNFEEEVLFHSLQDKRSFLNAWNRYFESKLSDDCEMFAGVGSLFASYQRMLWVLFEAGGDAELHVRYLIHHGFVDPLLRAPHLTAAGLCLRSVLLKTHPDLVDELFELDS
ncbi:MAG: hypothetical protein Q6373_021495 [Candidatus Sigynarchaeota archaeon]